MYIQLETVTSIRFWYLLSSKPCYLDCLQICWERCSDHRAWQVDWLQHRHWVKSATRDHPLPAELPQCSVVVRCSDWGDCSHSELCCCSGSVPHTVGTSASACDKHTRRNNAGLQTFSWVCTCQLSRRVLIWRLTSTSQTLSRVVLKSTGHRRD